MKFDIHKKEQEGLLYENGKIISHSKLKLWTFFWGHGEHEWPSTIVEPIWCILQNVSQTLYYKNKEGINCSLYAI